MICCIKISRCVQLRCQLLLHLVCPISLTVAVTVDEIARVDDHLGQCDQNHEAPNC